MTLADSIITDGRSMKAKVSQVFENFCPLVIEPLSFISQGTPSNQDRDTHGDRNNA